MSIKLSDQCSDCGKKIKRYHLYQTKTLCGTCYKKNFVIIPSLPKVFNEPLDQQIGFTLTLTKSQRVALDERMAYLFPTGKKIRVKYLRALVLGDLRYWIQRKEGKGIK